MNDCSNAEIRDRLPDLLHERLDASARATVAAHVADCADCREELELLRDVRAALAAQTPRDRHRRRRAARFPQPPPRSAGPIRRRDAARARLAHLRRRR